MRLGRQRVALDAVGSDREARQAADLGPVVEDGDRVPRGGELPGAREPAGPGAEHRDPPAGECAALPGLDAVRERPVRRVALEPRHVDRPAALAEQDAGALAEHLDRADARAGGAEEVLGEDRARRLARRRRERRDEAGDVDVRRARDDARRRRVRRTAFEAAVGLEQRWLVVQRWAQLGREFGRHARKALAPEATAASGGPRMRPRDTTDCSGCGKPAGAPFRGVADVAEARADHDSAP